MAKFKVMFDRELCIGALSCFSVNEKFWKLSNDGKVDLINSTFNEQTKKWELIIDEKDLKINEESAQVCPVTAIIIEKISED